MTFKIRNISIITKLTFCVIFLFLLFPKEASSQQCLGGGCTNFGSNYPGGTLTTMSASWTTVATNIWASEWAYYSVSLGSTYEWSLCAADGGSCSYDGQLSLTSSDGATQYCYSDDYCGDDSKIGWTATFTGTVRVLVSLYSCSSNSVSTTLVWRCSNYVTPCTAGSISGAPATICTGSNVTYTWAGTGTFTCFQYQWDGTGGTWTDWGATNPYTWTSSWAGHTLYVRAKIAGGTCYSAAVSTLVLDNVVSAGSISPSSSSICAGSSVTLNSTVNSSAAGNPTLYIKWYRHDGSSWTFLTQNNSQTLTDSPPAGSYTYLRRTWTSCAVDECNPGCYDATTTVTVNSLSTAPTSASASVTPVCSGSPTTLTVSGGSLGSGGNWSWGYGSCGNPIFYENWNTQPYGVVSTTVNSVAGGLINVTSTSTDPMIGMEAVGSFDPTIYKYIQIRYRVLAGTAGNAEIFYTNGRSASAVGDQMVSGALISDGAWHSLAINMSAGTYWVGYGNILGWRFDWATNSGVTMEIDNISLSIGQGTSIVVNPTATTTYYVRAEGVCNTTACVNTTVSVVSGLPAIPYAGEDQYICGATSVTMAASGSGTWSVVSGPNTPNIVSPNATNTQIGTVTGLISGTYVFRWSTSNVCGASYDDVVVIKQ